MDQRVKKIIDLMKEDLHQDRNLSEMAQTVNLTPSYLCRLFKAQTGVTPAKYFKQIRMQKAKELLETTFLNVKQIMNEIGLTDESHFVRDFEFHYGLSPAKYRAHYARERSSSED